MRMKAVSPSKFLLIILGLMFVPLSQANTFLDAALSAGYEDNVTRGFKSPNIDSSFILNTTVSGGKFWQLGSNTTLVAGASVGISNFINLPGFNRNELGVSLSVNYKFGMGAYSPRAGITATADRDYSKGDERDRDLYNVQMTLGKRFTPAWSAELGISRETSRGNSENWVDFKKLPYIPGITRPTDPFDYYNNVAFASVDYDLESGWLINISYQYIDGYIVASAVPPVPELFLHAKAVALDPAFNHRQLLYLLKSETDGIAVTLSIPLGQDSALDLRYSAQDIFAPHVGDYGNWGTSVTLLHRF